MQEVQLDSKIKLLDSPGIVFASGNDNSVSLKNAVRISALSDPITPANAILQRVSKKQMMEIYDIPEYSTPEVRRLPQLKCLCYSIHNLFLGILLSKSKTHRKVEERWSSRYHNCSKRFARRLEQVKSKR